jgi:hypothetical protein
MRRLSLLIVTVLMSSSLLTAQQPARSGQATTPKPSTSTPRAAAPVMSSGQNVRLDFVITDSLIADSQAKKSVSMLLLDGNRGQVRSTGGNGVLNVDARPLVRKDGRIAVDLTLLYQPELDAKELQAAGTARIAIFNESLVLAVTDGTPVVASQSADPRSDRKVSLEVTATVVK